jgi:hypothetical protein
VDTRIYEWFEPSEYNTLRSQDELLYCMLAVQARVELASESFAWKGLLS